MPNYVQTDVLTEYIRGQVTADDAVVESALNSAEAMVNDFCQRSFVVATTATARSYMPHRPGEYVLRIHDCTTVTSVTENGATVAASDYQTEPVTKSWAGLTVPIEQLRRYWTCWEYDQGFARISVTATWGWAATPDAVIESTKIIAKDILQQRNNNSGVAGFGEYGAIRVRMNPIAIDLLQPYQRAEAFGLG
jgi:hypothetical protein